MILNLHDKQNMEKGNKEIIQEKKQQEKMIGYHYWQKDFVICKLLG